MIDQGLGFDVGDKIFVVSCGEQLWICGDLCVGVDQLCDDFL